MKHNMVTISDALGGVVHWPVVSQQPTLVITLQSICFVSCFALDLFFHLSLFSMIFLMRFVQRNVFWPVLRSDVSFEIPTNFQVRFVYSKADK